MLPKINQHPVALHRVHMTGNSVGHDAAHTVLVKKIFQAKLDMICR
ncbi:hypothetical protein ALP29_201389 [Pseudomonas syringae pv. avii]|uniref:Uncharacterized protein n=1 Tax=Pseudomonas syringae pv. avii TaxID=663959 RepID=A0A3M5V2I3_PSESX|nr:hypothetical protein ALP29_201389 [Pseudomonas syringae pv. avii]